MLAIESQQAIWLRGLRIARGGRMAQREAARAVTEKAVAATESGAMIVLGSSPDKVVKAYRRKVRANVRRLSK